MHSRIRIISRWNCTEKKYIYAEPVYLGCVKHYYLYLLCFALLFYPIYWCMLLNICCCRNPISPEGSHSFIKCNLILGFITLNLPSTICCVLRPPSLRLALMCTLQKHPIETNVNSHQLPAPPSQPLFLYFHAKQSHLKVFITVRLQLCFTYDKKIVNKMQS